MKGAKDTLTDALFHTQSWTGDVGTSTTSPLEGATASGADPYRRLPLTAAPRIHEQGNQLGAVLLPYQHTRS